MGVQPAKCMKTINTESPYRCSVRVENQKDREIELMTVLSKYRKEYLKLEKANWVVVGNLKQNDFMSVVDFPLIADEDENNQLYIRQLSICIKFKAFRENLIYLSRVSSISVCQLLRVRITHKQEIVLEVDKHQHTLKMERVTGEDEKSICEAIKKIKKSMK